MTRTKKAKAPHLVVTRYAAKLDRDGNMRVLEATFEQRPSTWRKLTEQLTPEGTRGFSYSNISRGPTAPGSATRAEAIDRWLSSNEFEIQQAVARLAQLRSKRESVIVQVNTGQIK